MFFHSLAQILARVALECCKDLRPGMALQALRLYEAGKPGTGRKRRSDLRQRHRQLLSVCPVLAVKERKQMDSKCQRKQGPAGNKVQVGLCESNRQSSKSFGAKMRRAVSFVPEKLHSMRCHFHPNLKRTLCQVAVYLPS